MEYLRNNWPTVAQLAADHLWMSGAALLISLAVALPVSPFLVRWRAARAGVLGVLSVIYTIPSIAMLILLLPLFGLGRTAVIVALILYTQIILLRNMVAGLESVPTAVLEAATGMGMTPFQRWAWVQMPLALPILLAGVRLAAVVALAIATIGAKFGAGGLGTLLFEGIAQNRYDKIVLGAVLIGGLAMGINQLLIWLERRIAVWRV